MLSDEVFCRSLVSTSHYQHQSWPIPLAKKSLLEMSLRKSYAYEELNQVEEVAMIDATDSHRLIGPILATKFLSNFSSLYQIAGGRSE